ncbi:MAG: thiamine pyrophosphate-dependent dehydrogenase E1 component subunit alpha [Deltaproteobacteria bacterium]|nr:thiamine pyrophosphate-dependent dehydrogenase E1 component subunit alpha [Deltaproteobacteria bacterium]
MDIKGFEAGIVKTLYRQMVLIRKFEEKLMELSRVKDRLPGMQILAIGQEAVAVGIVQALEPADVLVSNHRSHGHLLAKGADPRALLAEIMGKATGVNKGKSGTLHLAVPEKRILMTSTVVGAGPPLAVGAAFAQQYRKEPLITVVFFGDGAAAEGSVHEAMNLAALWKLPVLFVCENNCWAGAQSLAQHCSLGRIADRALAYGFPGKVVDGNDVLEVYTVARESIAFCRNGGGPALIEANTYRMRGHGDYDHQHSVDRQELEDWARRSPILRLEAALATGSILDKEGLEAIQRECQERIDEALIFADQSPYPLPAEALEDVWV